MQHLLQQANPPTTTPTHSLVTKYMMSTFCMNFYESCIEYFVLQRISNNKKNQLQSFRSHLALQLLYMECFHLRSFEKLKKLIYQNRELKKQ
jgi:hypothetical protein